MTKTATYQKGDSLAVVRINADGCVEVERDGDVTGFNPVFTIDQVTKNFENSGWVKQVSPMVAAVAKRQGIPVDVQIEIDTYLELHEQKAKLEARLKKIKGCIKDHMTEEGHTSLQGTDGRIVALQDALSANSTSMYSDYELEDVVSALKGNEQYIPAVTELRVNTHAFEAFAKNQPKQFREQLLALKIAEYGTPRFVVKKGGK